MPDRLTKNVSDSETVMTELVLPNDTNQLGNLLGGRLMHWIDICAATAAARHSNRVCVTASVDRIDFHNPIKLGNVVILKASVNRVFSTSMEVGVKIFAEDPKTGNIIHTNSAYLTFVSVDENGKPVLAPLVNPVTDEEKRRYEEALIRRGNRIKQNLS
ncbi:MAG: acyl-CoA thioesterase [Ignavibacteria bacterium]|nr:acyl-CoA thioesterase [Ignavibacteria bacterium]